MNLFGILILFFFWLNQRHSGSLALDDKLFRGILVALMVEQLLDAGQWALEGVVFEGSYPLQVLCYTLGHSLAPGITCLWAMYCDLRTNMDERAFKRRLPLYLAPMVGNMLLLIANLFTPLMFRVDAAHAYHRGQLFWVYMLLMYAYGLISMWLIVRKALTAESALDRTEYRSLALFIIPPLIGGAFQWMFYGLSLIWFSMVLSIVLVYTNVLSRQISTDSLTGLNNRRKLNRYLDMKLKAPDAEHAIFLMMLDADNFKDINDQYGHSVGDRALIAIAELLKRACQGREYFLARLGGDEFVIIGCERDDNQPDALASKLRDSFSAFNSSTREPYRIALSIGWARYDPDMLNTPDALLTAADQRMYREKAVKQQQTML